MTEQSYRGDTDPLFPQALEIVNKIVRKPPNPALLYHYTSPEATQLIIERGIVRASNVRFVNDPSEVQYAVEVIAGVVHQYISRLPKVAGRILERAVSAFEHILDHFDYYVASFSAEADLLGQWRAYCGAGRGFAVGFHGAPLTRLGNDIYLFRVTYDRIEQEWATRAMLELYLPSLIRSAEQDDENATIAAGALLGTPTELLLLAFKQQTYADEREYRLIRSNATSLPLTDVHFRSTANMIVPFVEFNLADYHGNTTGNAPLAEIVIGPSVDSARARKALRMLSEKLGYEAQIRLSEVPFVG